MAQPTWYIAASFTDGDGKGQVRFRMTGLPAALAKRIYNSIGKGKFVAWPAGTDEQRTPFSWSMGREDNA